jgi:hypothetical protein
MQDIRSYLEKLRIQCAECEIIRDLGTDPKKRELFTTQPRLDHRGEELPDKELLSAT